MKTSQPKLVKYSQQLLAIALMTVSFGAMAGHHGDAEEAIGDLKDMATETEAGDATTEVAAEKAEEMLDKEGISTDAAETTNSLAE